MILGGWKDHRFTSYCVLDHSTWYVSYRKKDLWSDLFIVTVLIRVSIPILSPPIFIPFLFMANGNSSCFSIQHFLIYSWILSGTSITTTKLCGKNFLPCYLDLFYFQGEIWNVYRRCHLRLLIQSGWRSMPRFVCGYGIQWNHASSHVMLLASTYAVCSLSQTWADDTNV